MLATFIIGLREGLEAALIVGIIAAFLKRNNRSLTPMLIGVGAAIALSLGVGLGLHAVEASLPQSAQEGMEAVIGTVAVIFVTSMVLWMAGHARGLKGRLEADAGEALGVGTTRALVVMAFLAVLKEGFETAVFLLATFTAASNALLAASGAALGIAVAAGIGYGIYTGGLRINLGRFFSVTSVFLLLVAAGLVVNTLRAMREAGWLNAGQQRTVDLSWVAAPGSIQGALFTGVLGIPSDPRVIQVVAWFAYVVPMALLLYWPRRHRPAARTTQRLRYAIAGALAVAAATLAQVIGPATLPAAAPATLLDASGRPVGTVTLEAGRARLAMGGVTSDMALTGGVVQAHAGVSDAVAYSQPSPAPTGLPASLTLDELVALNGGRVPVGINPQTARGPFTAAWSFTGQQTLWLARDRVLDFASTPSATVTLTGGGLPNPRTLTVTGPQPSVPSLTAPLSVDPAHVSQTAAAVTRLGADQQERDLWGRAVPLVLLALAVLVLTVAVRARRALTDQPTSRAVAPAAPLRSPHHVA